MKILIILILMSNVFISYFNFTYTVKTLLTTSIMTVSGLRIMQQCDVMRENDDNSYSSSKDKLISKKQM